MLVDELRMRLAMLPGDTDVVVDVGVHQVDVADIVDLGIGADRHTVALALDPGDLRDAFAVIERRGR